jgi:hypothetical protein
MSPPDEAPVFGFVGLHAGTTKPKSRKSAPVPVVDKVADGVDGNSEPDESAHPSQISTTGSLTDTVGLHTDRFDLVQRGIEGGEDLTVSRLWSKTRPT